MAKGDIRAKMEELYPTAADMLRDREHYPSWKALAEAIKVSEYSVCDHRKRLGMERVGRAKTGEKQKKSFSKVTENDIQKAIKVLFVAEHNNMVRKYKITDPIFFEDMCGNEGLEFIGEERGVTWRTIHNPSILTEGRNI